MDKAVDVVRHAFRTSCHLQNSFAIEVSGYVTFLPTSQENLKNRLAETEVIDEIQYRLPSCIGAFIQTVNDDKPLGVRSSQLEEVANRSILLRVSVFSLDTQQSFWNPLLLSAPLLEKCQDESAGASKQYVGNSKICETYSARSTMALVLEVLNNL